MKLFNAKLLIKLTALTIVCLEVYWVVILKHEPHAMSVGGAISGLFGINGMHEHFNPICNKDDPQ